MKPLYWILIGVAFLLIITLVLLSISKAQSSSTGSGSTGSGSTVKTSYCFKDGDKQAKAKCLAEGGQIDKLASGCGLFYNKCFFN